MKNTITLFAMLLIAILASSSSFSQTQIGEDIDGAVAYEHTGSSVSLSSNGMRIAILSKGSEVTGSKVRLYEWDGGSWMQMGAAIYPESGFEFLGKIVSLSSDGLRVAIGVLDWDESGFDRGQVRVYEWDGVSWTQMGEDIDGEGDSDISGWSVSLSSDGSRVAIGAPFNDGAGTGFSTGHVRVYEWDGGNWVQMGGDIDGEGAEDLFGSSVSLSSDGIRVAVGATEWWQIGTIEEGYVRVYEWNDGSWTQMGEDINGKAVEDHFGSSVSLSSDGGRVAIGAPGNDGNGPGSGHVRVYEWDGVSWTQMGEDIDGEAAEDASGSSVSLSSDGTRVAIGAPGNDGNGTNAGHIRVFDLTTVSTATINASSMISVFPNPTAGKIELFGVENGTIRIFDKIGRVILEAENPGSEIDISDLATGVYFVQFIVDGQMITKRIIKS